MKRHLGKLLGDRRIMGALLILIQAVLVIWGLGTLSDHVPWIYRLCNILSVIIIIWIVRKYDNPSYKIPWIVLILLFPLFGGIFYLAWGNTPFNRAWRRINSRYRSRTSRKASPIRQAAGWSQRCRAIPAAPVISNRSLGMPAWGNCGAVFPAPGKTSLPPCAGSSNRHGALSAEYFITEQGEMWQPILISTEKAKQGWRCALCTTTRADVQTARGLRPVPALARHTHRALQPLYPHAEHLSHLPRPPQITVDGGVGYMGGANIVDEYINRKSPFH